MRKNTLSIHSENILPIIKKWLYSSRDIFLRELISNSSDAFKKLRVLRESDQAPKDDAPLEIHVRLDKKNKTLTISDNAIGMTEDDVERYIAQIAFSSAEEFVAKYKEQSEKDPMIGHFGLGFYSSYMVAARVELNTRSYLPDAQPVSWSCDGSSSYEIGQGTRETRGTDVILHLDDESATYLNEIKIRELLNRYCAFMPESIFFQDKPLNNTAPLWMKNPSECTDKEYLEFYQKLYPQEPDPMFWIHLNVDYPFRLKGILYFPKHFHAVQEKNLPIKLFCNRVFVSDDCREILPDYLMMLCGAIDSADIPLNVSRSYLQVDQNVKQVGSHISKKVADRINHLLKTDRDQYLTYWNELGLFLKYGLLRDDKFYERTKDALIWKNSSNEWTTIQDYLDRAKEKKVYYCTEDCSTILQKAFINRGLELIYTGSNPINSPVLTKLEEKFSPVQFQRIDSELENALLDESREKTVLDQDGKTQAGRIRNLFQSNLSADLVEVEAKSLSSDALPGLLLIDERTRRFREYLGLTEQNMKSSAFGKSKFVVNTNNKLVQKAWKLADHQPELAKLLITQLYDLARVAQKEIEPKELDGILVRNQELLEQLAERLPT